MGVAFVRRLTQVLQKLEGRSAWTEESPESPDPPDAKFAKIAKRAQEKRSSFATKHPLRFCLRWRCWRCLGRRAHGAWARGLQSRFVCAVCAGPRVPGC